MKTVEIKIYSFDELSEEAKERARDEIRERVDTSHNWNEAHESVKSFCEAFGIETGLDSWLRFRHWFEDPIKDLRGLRLRTYLINNFGYVLWKRKYLKHGKNRAENPGTRHKMTNWKFSDYSKEWYPVYYSNIQEESKNCNLTGVCWDEELLSPFYAFIEKPNKSDSIIDLIGEGFQNLRKSLEDEDYYRTYGEGIDEECRQANFEEDGSFYEWD